MGGFPGGSDGKGSLHQEDPLEKGMATHSSILTWKIPWAEGLAGVTESDTTEQHTHTHAHTPVRAHTGLIGLLEGL